jgi:SPP1 family predicted phage head-tail adaptor
MKAGRLRHWLAFEARVEDVNSDGEREAVRWVPAFAANHIMPCDVEELSGRELIAAQAVQSKVTARIVVRFRPGLESTEFVAALRARRPDGIIYNIEAAIADLDSMRTHVTLLASRGLDTGG